MIGGLNISVCVLVADIELEELMTFTLSSNSSSEEAKWREGMNFLKVEAAVDKVSGKDTPKTTQMTPAVETLEIRE